MRVGDRIIGLNGSGGVEIQPVQLLLQSRRDTIPKEFPIFVQERGALLQAAPTLFDAYPPLFTAKSLRRG